MGKKLALFQKKLVLKYKKGKVLEMSTNGLIGIIVIISITYLFAKYIDRRADITIEKMQIADPDFVRKMREAYEESKKEKMKKKCKNK